MPGLFLEKRGLKGDLRDVYKRMRHLEVGHNGVLTLVEGLRTEGYKYTIKQLKKNLHCAVFD